MFLKQLAERSILHLRMHPEVGRIGNRIIRFFRILSGRLEISSQLQTMSLRSVSQTRNENELGFDQRGKKGEIDQEERSSASRDQCYKTFYAFSFYDPKV